MLISFTSFQKQCWIEYFPPSCLWRKHGQHISTFSSSCILYTADQMWFFLITPGVRTGKSFLRATGKVKSSSNGNFIYRTASRSMDRFADMRSVCMFPQSSPALIHLCSDWTKTKFLSKSQNTETEWDWEICFHGNYTVSLAWLHSMCVIPIRQNTVLVCVCVCPAKYCFSYQLDGKNHMEDKMSIIMCYQPAAVVEPSQSYSPSVMDLYCKLSLCTEKQIFQTWQSHKDHAHGTLRY